jgi:hypothetical protein
MFLTPEYYASSISIIKKFGINAFRKYCILKIALFENEK